MKGLSFDHLEPTDLALRWELIHADGDCGGEADGCPICIGDGYSGVPEFDADEFLHSHEQHGPVKILSAEEIDALYPNREYRVNAGRN